MRELEHLIEYGSVDFWINVGLVVLCICGAALAAGLTMGLLAIEPFRLQILLATEEEDCQSPREIKELKEEKNYAKNILPLISNHHLLLVSLLLLNSIANEALPIFLDKLVPTGAAIVLSVTFVLLFGEIIPSAIFTGPRQLEIASTFVPFVRLVQLVFFPIAWPISKILDSLLGHDDDGKFNKAELRALVKLHGKGTGHINSCAHDEDVDKVINVVVKGVEDQASKNLGMDRKGKLQKTLSQYTEYTDNELDVDEVTIIHGAMDLKELKAKDIMRPLHKVLMMEISEKLSYQVLTNILEIGHSRLPIYEGNRENIRGLLLVKKLILLDPKACRDVSSMELRQPLYILPDMTLLELLNHFQVGKSHMAIVCSNPHRMEQFIKQGKPIPDDIQVMGMLTLEDLIETLIQENIKDETDRDEYGLTGLSRAQKLQQISEIARIDAELTVRQKLKERHSGAVSLTSAIGSASTSRYGSRSAVTEKNYGSLGSSDNFGSFVSSDSILAESAQTTTPLLSSKPDSSK